MSAHHHHEHGEGCSCHHHDYVYVPFAYLEKYPEFVKMQQEKAWAFTQIANLEAGKNSFACDLGKNLSQFLLTGKSQEFEQFLSDNALQNQFSPSALVAFYSNKGLTDITLGLIEFSRAFKLEVSKAEFSTPLLTKALENLEAQLTLLIKDLEVYLSKVNAYTAENQPIKNVVEKGLFNITSLFKSTDFSSPQNYNLIIDLIPELTLFAQQTISYEVFRSNTSGLMFDSIFEILVAVPTE